MKNVSEDGYVFVLQKNKIAVYKIIQGQTWKKMFSCRWVCSTSVHQYAQFLWRCTFRASLASITVLAWLAWTNLHFRVSDRLLDLFILSVKEKKTLSTLHSSFAAHLQHVLLYILLACIGGICSANGSKLFVWNIKFAANATYNRGM